MTLVHSSTYTAPLLVAPLLEMRPLSVIGLPMGFPELQEVQAQDGAWATVPAVGLKPELIVIERERATPQQALAHSGDREEQQRAALVSIMASVMNESDRVCGWERAADGSRDDEMISTIIVTVHHTTPPTGPSHRSDPVHSTLRQVVQ